MSKSFLISSPKSSNIVMTVTPGHFTTSSSHVSHYLDMGALTHNVRAAKDVARELAIPYTSQHKIDTIVCLEGTQIIGAYLADELMREESRTMKTERAIFVASPMNNVNGQLIFQNNEHELIKNKNVLLLVSSVSSGKTVYRALDCLAYYGGKLIGISSLFAAVPNVYGHDVNAVFIGEDIPNYTFCRAADCKLCKEGMKLDAIVNYGGYTGL